MTNKYYEEVNPQTRKIIAGLPLKAFSFDSTSEAQSLVENPRDFNRAQDRLLTAFRGNNNNTIRRREEVAADDDSDQIAWNSIPCDLRALFDTGSLTVAMSLCLLNSIHCQKLTVNLFSDTIIWRTFGQWKTYLQYTGLFYWKSERVEPTQNGALAEERHFFTLKKIEQGFSNSIVGQQESHREKFTSQNAEDYTVCNILFTKKNQPRAKTDQDLENLECMAPDPLDRALREKLKTARTVLQIVDLKFQWCDLFGC